MTKKSATKTKARAKPTTKCRISVDFEVTVDGARSLPAFHPLEFMLAGIRELQRLGKLPAQPNDSVHAHRWKVSQVDEAELKRRETRAKKIAKVKP